jgi:hypothetical protein
MLQQVRRIITANNEDGQSYILSDSPSPHVTETAPHRGLTDLWAMFDGGPDIVTVDGADRPVVLSPASGGNIFRFFQLPPASASATTQEAAARVFEKMGGAHERVAESRDPTMHLTQTIDYIILLKGRVKLVLDEQDTILNPFDVVIQRRTNHAWINVEEEPALMMAVLVDLNTAKD